MKGKIRFKLSKDFFFNKRKYGVFVNGTHVGDLSNRNLELDVTENYGLHQIEIVGKNYIKKFDLNIGPANVINPVYVSHSIPSGIKTPKLVRVFLIILFIAIFVYYIAVKEQIPNYLLALVIFFSVFLLRENEKEFKIHHKRF